MEIDDAASHHHAAWPRSEILDVNVSVFATRLPSGRRKGMQGGGDFCGGKAIACFFWIEGQRRSRVCAFQSRDFDLEEGFDRGGF